MKRFGTQLLLLVLMCGASVLAIVLRPTKKIADLQPRINLITVIPQRFGEWHEEPQKRASVINPQLKEVLDRIYSQTLTRTYVNSKGYSIMLSVAYGGNQSDLMQVHKPEKCYPAQGFRLEWSQAGVLETRFGRIPVRRLFTTRGPRREPVTYWIVVGNRTIAGGFDKKLVEMKYGLSGTIPDGLLLRVSSIDSDEKTAFAIHSAFLDQFLDAASPKARYRLSGIGSASQ